MLDVSLVVIGFIIVTISYFVSEKIEQGQNLAGSLEQSAQIHEIWSEKDEAQVRSQVETVISQTMDEMIDHADEELSKISNEKIMAMDEFSNQLLEKIEANHKEVVFLYNMLNTKQDEIKNMITEADLSKTALEDFIRLSNEKTREAYTGIDLLQQVAKDGKEKTYEGLEKKEKEAISEILNEKELPLEKSGEESMNKEKTEEPSINEEDKSEIEETEMKESELKEENKTDLKESVLNLYREGKSILEISKLLNVGQGEVKLIIDLYQGVEV